MVDNDFGKFESLIKILQNYQHYQIFQALLNLSGI